MSTSVLHHAVVSRHLVGWTAKAAARRWNRTVAVVGESAFEAERYQDCPFRWCVRAYRLSR